MISIRSALALALLSVGATAQEGAPTEFQLKGIDTLYQNRQDQGYPRFQPGSTTEPTAQSPRFAIYGPAGPDCDKALNFLEAAYSCYVETLGWPSSGVSTKAGITGYFKTNVYQVANFSSSPSNIAGQQYTDSANGRGYFGVGSRWVDNAGVSVHEYGHVLHYHAKTWTGAEARPWWETIASFVSDYAANGEACQPSREAFNVTSTSTNIDYISLISNGHQVIVDATPNSPTVNLYKAWPFFMYLTNNPDQFPNLGRDTVLNLFKQYKTGETPLQTLQTVAGPGLSVQTIVASYWARVAYADLWHEKAAVAFNRAQRQTGTRALNYANLDSTGTNTWRVKADRQPKYMGASFVPLTAAAPGPVTVKIGATAPFEARIAVRAPGYGKVRYTYVQNGQATVDIGQGDEAMLVVVNAPAQLITYDPRKIAGSPADAGLDYTVEIQGGAVGTGAAPAQAAGTTPRTQSMAAVAMTEGEAVTSFSAMEIDEIAPEKDVVEDDGAVDELEGLECGDSHLDDDE